MANLAVILTDAAAWVWSLDGPPAPWLRLDASADGHAALLRWLGQHSGELRCHVLVDLSSETLRYTLQPALSWFNRRALAGQKTQDAQQLLIQRAFVAPDKPAGELRRAMMQPACPQAVHRRMQQQDAAGRQRQPVKQAQAEQGG